MVAVVDPADLCQQRADRVLVPSLRIGVALDPAVGDRWPRVRGMTGHRGAERGAGRRRMAVAADVAIEEAAAAGAPQPERVVALDDAARAVRVRRRSRAVWTVDQSAGSTIGATPAGFTRPEPAGVDRVGEDLADVGLREPGRPRDLPVGQSGRRELVGAAHDRPPVGSSIRMTEGLPSRMMPNGARLPPGTPSRRRFAA